MHWFPQRTRLNISLVKSNAHGLNITIRFKLGMNRLCRVGNASCTTHSTINNLGINSIVTLHTQMLIKKNSA